ALVDWQASSSGSLTARTVTAGPEDPPEEGGSRRSALRHHAPRPYVSRVPAQRLLEQMRSLPAEGTVERAVEVVLEHGPVIRMCAVVDQHAGPAARRQSAEIGDPLLGDDDVDVVLGVVHVRDHG